MASWGLCAGAGRKLAVAVAEGVGYREGLRAWTELEERRARAEAEAAEEEAGEGQRAHGLRGQASASKHPDAAHAVIA